MQIDGNGFWQGKRILIVSPEAWGPLRLSKHHYATSLMELGAEVYFLGPDTPKENRVRAAIEAVGQPAMLFRPPPLRGIRFLPRMARAWLEARQMRQLANAAGGGFDLLWNFDLYRFRWLTNRSNARRRIVHVMDLRNPGDLICPASLADLIIVVSPTMAEGLKEWQERVLYLAHGWMPRKRDAFALPALSEGVKIGYLGNLAMRAIDWDSIISIAISYPAVHIYLIGPMHGAFGDDTSIELGTEKRLRSLPNIKLVGPVPYDQVPTWLEAMDILLIAYDLEGVGLRATSSHKLLEYLASGKVIVSSYLEDHTALPGMVVMGKSGESISPYVGDVLRNLSAHNASSRQAERKTYAAAQSYKHKLALIAERLME